MTALFDVSIFKNRNVAIAIGVSLAILILIVVISPKANVSAPSPLASPLASTSRPELQTIPLSTRQASATYVASIASKLPIHEQNFATSVSITTTIDVYVAPGDPPETVRFEVTGISYLNKDSSALTNPNVTAFKESYLKGLSVMKSLGIDPTKVIFIYGDVGYVQDAAEKWVTDLKLLN